MKYLSMTRPATVFSYLYANEYVVTYFVLMFTLYSFYVQNCVQINGTLKIFAISKSRSTPFLENY